MHGRQFNATQAPAMSTATRSVPERVLKTLANGFAIALAVLATAALVIYVLVQRGFV